MQCMSVDFPDPDGPITAVNQPRSKVTSTPSSARTSAWPAPYVLRNPTAWAAGETCASSVVVSLISVTVPLRPDGTPVGAHKNMLTTNASGR